MYLGELVELGDAEEVLRNPQHPYTKVLKWATPSLSPDEGAEEPPVREIDIPDPVDPPSGCRFHTRCPYATEHCKASTPERRSVDGVAHRASCFRLDETSDYWHSEPLDGASLDADDR